MYLAMLNRLQILLKREIDSLEASMSIIEMSMKDMPKSRNCELVARVLEDLREARISLLRSFEKAGELEAVK